VSARPRPSAGPGGPTWLSGVLALVLGLTVSAAAPASLALATDQESVGATITADVLDPPTGLICNGGITVCDAGLSSRPTLAWTATSDPYATGYLVFRSTTSGSGYTQIGTVSGRTTTTFTDTTNGLVVASTYYYVVRAASASWTSVNSNQVAVTILLGL
jgi:hypothetical protein